MLSHQHTGLSTWRANRSGTAPAGYGSAVTLAMTGIRGSANRTPSRNARNCAAAAAMCREWNGALTRSATHRPAPAATTASLARRSASAGPESTTCSAELRLARSTSSMPDSLSSSAIRSGGPPTTATMPPPVARPISSPRRCTSRTPVAKSKQPAANSALYSPRLCPARKSGGGCSSMRARKLSALTTNSAGCT